MRIKVVGNITAKNLALLLMKTMAEMNVHEVNGANLYFGDGDKVVAVSAGGDTIPENHFTKQTHHKQKKKTPNNRWEPKPGIGCTKQLPPDNGTIPWD